MHFFDIATSKSGPRPTCFATFYFQMCFAPQRRALFRPRNVQKWSETQMFLYIFTSKCASRHNGVHFFNISTSKSRPELTCFVHFHFQMCFAPQWRALFQHLNFQKPSGADVFCTFSLPNVLRATTACTFFHISTSKSAPRPTCFDTFDFQMCFAPQRRALFTFSSAQISPHPPL